MEMPITSEVTLEIGTVLREIATGQLFVVNERLVEQADISGDKWKLTPTGEGSTVRLPVALSRQELSEKYFVAKES